MATVSGWRCISLVAARRRSPGPDSPPRVSHPPPIPPGGGVGSSGLSTFFPLRSWSARRRLRLVFLNFQTIRESAHQSTTISGERCLVSASPRPVGRPRCLVCAQPTTSAAHPGRGSRTRAASITSPHTNETKYTYFHSFRLNYILIGNNIEYGG